MRLHLITHVGAEDKTPEIKNKYDPLSIVFYLSLPIQATQYQYWVPLALYILKAGESV